jgi:hypothetical protein
MPQKVFLQILYFLPGIIAKLEILSWNTIVDLPNCLLCNKNENINAEWLYQCDVLSTLEDIMKKY